MTKFLTIKTGENSPLTIKQLVKDSSNNWQEAFSHYYRLYPNTEKYSDYYRLVDRINGGGHKT